MGKFLIPLGVFLALSVFFAVGLTRDPSYIPTPLQTLPAFTLQTLDEPPQTVTEQDIIGKPALLNVWGSWCANCGVEHDFLMRLARSGVPIYGLNWSDQRPAARRWLARLGDPYVASAFDEEGRVAIDLGVYGAPETFLIDPQGNVVHKHIGPLTPQIWERDFVPLLDAMRGSS